MEKMKIKGRVVWTGPISTIEKVDRETGEISSYQKAEFLVEYEDGERKFPAGFITWNQTAQIVGRLVAGDLVTVTFRPESKNKEGRIFTNLTAYGIYIHFDKFLKPEQVNTLPTVEEIDQDSKN
jgi:hypothetical protein